MSKAPGLSQSAAQLLLEIMEASTDAIIAGYPARTHVREITELQSAHLIMPMGHVAACADDDDRPRELVWSSETEGYGYFSELDGWVSVRNTNLDVLAVDFSRLLTLLINDFGLAGVSPRSLLPDYLWDLGAVRFGRRPKRTPVFFARRISEPSVNTSVWATLQRQGLSQRAVLLTSTRADIVGNTPKGYEVISLWDVASHENGLEIDPAVIAARLDRRPAVGDADLQIIDEGREVRLYKETFKFQRGIKQRDIIRFLHDRLMEGQDWVSSAEIQTELDLPDKTRIRDIFKGNRAWGRLLTERSGMCGFCFDVEEHK